MIGKKLSHYKVLEKIGQGGMGEVYRAEDTNLSREVAIKVLPEQFTKDPQRLARFEREAKLLASLNHPNIASIYGFEEADDVRFLAMELVPGETLAERVTKGPVPVEETLEICRQIAEGVEAAHEKGVIHRDLKPANVKVTPEGKVKILDFGLAKAFEDEIPAADISQSPTLTEEMTRAGVILGTAAYMSPEQARGNPVDKRADIFAFGSVLFEMLTGNRAFEGETVTDTIASVLKSEPEWDLLPPSIPSTIRFLMSRCLQKEAAKRLQHIDGARILIEEALSGATAVSPTGATIKTPFWKRAIPWSMAGVMAVIAISLAFWSSPQPVPQLLTKVTFSPPADAPLIYNVGFQLAISPDGRKIVYQAQLGAETQLYLRDLDDFIVRPLGGTEEGATPFFSPDGLSVAFTAGRQVKRVPIMGGAAITLCGMEVGIRGGSWVEDTIVFGTFGGAGLYRISAEGGEPESLAVPDPDRGENNYLFPRILPGGKAVLFSITSGDGWQTAVLFLETGEKKIVLEEAKQATYAATGHLVYELPGTGNLMAVPFDLEKFETTGGPVSILEGVEQRRDYAVDYTFSKDGTLVYIPHHTDVQSLVWVDRKGTESLIIQDEVSFGSPRISPDGKQFAVAISTSQDQQKIWIYDFQSELLRRLTFGFGAVENWSPDGKWIIFQSGTGARAISRKLADGSGQVEQLTDPLPAPQMPKSLTPDGSVLAFDRGGDIWLLPMDGDREPRPLITSPDHFEGHSKFSPDGEWIAYVSNELGVNSVYVSPYPDLDGKWLISGEEGSGEPVWSPDGTELFYRSGDKMITVPVQTEPTFNSGKPKVLFERSYVTSRFGAGGYPYYDISLDGQRFLMIKGEEGSTAQINVIQNWFEELKRLAPTN